MSVQESRRNAGQTFVQMIESGVKELVADRILPKDFVIKEFREDCVWGMSDSLVVVWDLDGRALSTTTDADAVQQTYIAYNDDNEKWEMQTGFELWPNAIFDIITSC